jgi:hypothetical protein
MRSLRAIGNELASFSCTAAASWTRSGSPPASWRSSISPRTGARAARSPERLCIGSTTVKSHFAGIYARLGVSDRTAAVATAMRYGLIR